MKTLSLSLPKSSHDAALDPVLSSEITTPAQYLNRRQLMGAAAGFGLLSGGMADAAPDTKRGAALAATRNPAYVAVDKVTPYENATTYNNFYEFGTDKADPVHAAQMLRVKPWQVCIEGDVLKPQTLDIDALLKLAPLEERIYRMRCVEGWSMVIPWIGYSLSALINKVQPTGNAKYVEFISLADKAQMPGVRVNVLQWPYTEGLRLDEAMHPLTLLSLGMYGEVMPKQNGAPVRLVVPWKYGFKSAKSIVAIRFTEKQPETSWVSAARSEYGFYSNVNPGVDHPRWSQATERRLPEDGLFAAKRKTALFNGYDQVASLYTGMDLKKNF